MDLDAFIARLFQLRFARIAGAAGMLGALGAAGSGAIVRVLGGGQGITPALPLAWNDLLWVLPCPVLAAIVAATAARLTASRLIREMQ